MGLNVKELASQMKEMEEKSDKYDDLKQNVDSVMGNINCKISEIQDLLSELSPVLSIKKRYHNAGGKLIEYIQACYKFLIETEDMFTISKLLKEVGLGHIQGGSEHNVRINLMKLKGIKTSPSSDDGRMKKFYYEKSEGKLELDQIPAILSDKIRQKEVGKIEVVEDNKELMDSIPKKTSYMG